MDSTPKLLVDFVIASMPLVREGWRVLYNKGYEARMEGKPRMYHGRSHRGPYFRGYDDADRLIAEKGIEYVLKIREEVI